MQLVVLVLDMPQDVESQVIASLKDAKCLLSILTSPLTS